jgi:hypothetical protein
MTKTIASGEIGTNWRAMQSRTLEDGLSCIVPQLAARSTRTPSFGACRTTMK